METSYSNDGAPLPTYTYRSPVPAPADTYNGPLETPFSNYDAPSPTFNFFRSPVPAPAYTSNGPLETPFSNYGAPIYTFAQGLSKLAQITAQGLSTLAQKTTQGLSKSAQGSSKSEERGEPFFENCKVLVQNQNPFVLPENSYALAAYYAENKSLPTALLKRSPKKMRSPRRPRGLKKLGKICIYLIVAKSLVIPN